LDKQRTEPYSSTIKNRVVNVSFWYPSKAGKDETFPQIVFSHGGLATVNSNLSLFQELASYGYVVYSIGHPYRTLWTQDEDGHITLVSPKYFSEIQHENAKINKIQSLQYYQSWMGIRMADINFVLDTILNSITNELDGVYRLINPEWIGLIGHSLGGSAMLGIPRQRDDIDAVIALESPYLYDLVGEENDTFIYAD
jgi:predicted dienelactone hydrolase